MPFDNEKYHRSALKGDVGYTAFIVGQSLSVIVDALEKISSDEKPDLSNEIRTLEANVVIMNNEFDNLTGWKPE